MRVVAVLAALAAAPLARGAEAQAPLWYCDPLGVYYPQAARCPVPWRAVDPSTLAQQPNAIAAPPPTIGKPTPLLPTATGDDPAPSGGALAEWCAKVRLPSNIAICSDPELRSMMIERQHAYNEAIGRLMPEQQKALLADQTGWVKSYPRACGLTPDTPPPLPLAPAIKECMAQAGRSRLAYLRAYGGTSPAAPANAPLTTESASRPIAEMPIASPSVAVPPGPVPLPSKFAPKQNAGTPDAPAASEPVSTVFEKSGQSGNDRLFGIIILLGLLLMVIVIWFLKRKAKKNREQRVLRVANDTINLHKRALIRKRFQSLRHDDYGNFIIEPWHKELSYFMEKS
jgi:hypothetical protein